LVNLLFISFVSIEFYFGGFTSFTKIALFHLGIFTMFYHGSITFAALYVFTNMFGTLPVLFFTISATISAAFDLSTIYPFF
jgi:hypothetical protein